MRTRIEADVVVQHRGTGAYIAREGQPRWTDDAIMARLFETPYHALHFCVDNKLKNADILLRSGNGREERFLRC